MDTRQKYVYKCPICGHTFTEESVEREDRTCTQCGKSTYTIRSEASIRKIFRLQPEKEEKR